MKTWQKKILLILTLILSLEVKSQSSGLLSFEDAIYPEIVTSARALGLGNAYIAKVDDSASAFYNPAGLGTVRYPHFHISNVHIEWNKGYQSNVTDNIFDSFANVPNSLSVDGLGELLRGNVGALSHSRFQLMPNITTRFFSAGFLYSVRTRGAIENVGARNDFIFAQRKDFGPYLSLNLSLFGGVLKIGSTVTYLTREESIGRRDEAITAELTDSEIDRGRGINVIGGAKLTLPIAFLPTLAVKVNNATSDNFAASEGFRGAPGRIQRSIDLGLSLTPRLGQTSRFHFEINYKDLTQRFSDVSNSRRFGAGIELDLSRILFFRLGYGDGFGSGGFGIRTRKFEVDFTTYAVDTTSSSFRGTEDRRFAFSISSGI